MLDLKPGQLRAQMCQDQEKGNTISCHRNTIIVIEFNSKIKLGDQLKNF